MKKLETASAKDKMMMEQKYGQLLALRKRLKASKDEHIEFVRIEAVGEDDSKGAEIPIFALAVFKVHGPGNKTSPKKSNMLWPSSKGC